MRFILCCFLVCFFTIGIVAQRNQLFSFNDGLSNGLVNQIFQDKKGLLWIATNYGLYRFDGIKFKSYYHDDNDTLSLKSNYIKSILNDNNDGLLIACNFGVIKFDYKTESFKDIPFYYRGKRVLFYVTKLIRSRDGTIWISSLGSGLLYIDNKTGEIIYPETLNDRLSGSYYEYIFEDKEGLIWIGSDDSGFSSYNKATDEVRNYPENKSQFPSSSFISSICEDDKQNIYIGTLKNGLFKFNKTNREISRVESGIQGEHVIQVKSLLFDSKKHLWVGTDGKGLRLLNKNTGKLEELLPNNSPINFSQSKIHSIIEDNYGNVWLGIYQKGIFLFPNNPGMFKHYGYKPFDKQNIGSNCVMSIVTDSKYIWVATDGDGIYRLNKDSKEVTHILLNSPDGKYSGNNVIAMFDDGDGNLWIGTYLNGLIKLNKQSYKIEVFRNETGNINSLPNDRVYCITKDKKGYIWVGTYGGGIARFDSKTGKFYQEFNDTINKYNLQNRFVNSIYIDENDNFWIAGYVGLAYVEPNKKKITHYFAKDGFLPSDMIYTIKPDNKGNLWIGTYEGLVKFDEKNRKSKIYKIKDGLPCNLIFSIEVDEFNQIWISTLNGLSKLDPQKEVFTNYFAYDGLQSNEFSAKASCKGTSNELYFGGINGMTEIISKNEELLKTNHNVLFTDFILFDKPVKIGQKSGKYEVLDKSVLIEDTIELSSIDNFFTIEFATTDFANRANIDFEYKLIGVDKGWIRCGPMNNRATYTNLNYGSYKFLVRGIRKDNTSPTKELTIIIYPPWYFTKIAIFGWTLIALLILAWIFIYFRDRIRHGQAEKLNDMKMQFFMDISHEIKTPLTLILDPLDKLKRKMLGAETTNLLSIMQKNTSRIINLINQLLDVRKIEKGQLTLHFQNINVYNYINEISEIYKAIASDKGISFTIECSAPGLEFWIDTLNFEKVIQNLLSNALKFTETGSIVVSISEKNLNSLDNKKENYIQISISDTGIGIPESEMSKIFERFYQVQNIANRFNKGSGIGLHLAKSMVKLHKGSIFAESRTDCKGSRFVVLMPMGTNHIQQKDLIQKEEIEDIQSTSSLQNVVLEDLSNKKQRQRKSTSYKVMIVDDEENIRNYLQLQLSDIYSVVSYNNGKDAFRNLLGIMPDVIISDILMPEMDGFTFCKKVKANPKTFNVPVVLLTALSKDEDKAEGIESGADIYLTKPFKTEILKRVLASLLKNKRRIEKISENSEQNNIAHIKLNSHDEIMMQKVMAIIKENIANVDLNVEILADGLGMSRSNLHRKLKTATNMSARDFIRDVRMKQAAYLLINNKVSISEIAYAVGFPNLSHFSRSFKEFYGVSPKEYIS